MELRERILAFAEFKKNWNGYNADPFSKKLIDRALEISTALEHCGWKVFPHSDACGIQFERDFETVHIEISVYEDRSSSFITCNAGCDE